MNHVQTLKQLVKRKFQKNEVTGKFRCESCNKEYDGCAYRYLSTFVINDYSGHRWASSFDEVGATIFGMTAEELSGKKTTSIEEYEKIILESNFQTFVFKLRIKDETSRTGDTLTKITIFKAYPLNHVKRSNTLLQEIANYQ